MNGSGTMVNAKLDCDLPDARNVLDREGQTSEASEAAELREYREFVAKVAEASNGETILNRSSKHASVIIEWLFRKSRDSMKIVTRELHSGVYGAPDVICAGLEFVRKGGRIDVASEKRINRNEHPLITAIDAAGFGDKVTISPKADGSTFPFHYAVGDACHFRFEQNPDDFAAIVQFGGAALGARLDQIFPSFQS